MARSHEADDGAEAETNSDHECVFDYDAIDEHVESMEPHEAQCDCCIEEALRLEQRASEVEGGVRSMLRDQVEDLRRQQKVVAYYFDDELAADFPIGGGIPDLTLCIACHRDEDYEYIFEDPELDTIEELAPGVDGIVTFDTPWGKLVSYYEDVRVTDRVRGPNVVGESVAVGREGYTEFVPDFEDQYKSAGIQVFDSPLRRRMIEEIAKEDYRGRRSSVDEEKMRGGY
jgi:hypothetical protein